MSLAVRRQPHPYVVVKYPESHPACHLITTHRVPSFAHMSTAFLLVHEPLYLYILF